MEMHVQSDSWIFACQSMDGGRALKTRQVNLKLVMTSCFECSFKDKTAGERIKLKVLFTFELDLKLICVVFGFPVDIVKPKKNHKLVKV